MLQTFPVLRYIFLTEPVRDFSIHVYFQQGVHFQTKVIVSPGHDGPRLGDWQLRYPRHFKQTQVINQPQPNTLKLRILFLSQENTNHSRDSMKWLKYRDEVHFSHQHDYCPGSCSSALVHCQDFSFIIKLVSWVLHSSGLAFRDRVEIRWAMPDLDTWDRISPTNSLFFSFQVYQITISHWHIQLLCSAVKPPISLYSHQNALCWLRCVASAKSTHLEINLFSLDFQNVNGVIPPKAYKAILGHVWDFLVKTRCGEIVPAIF